MHQSSTVSNPSSGTGNGSGRGQGSGLDQGYQLPVVRASYPTSDTMLEQAIPMTPTPSEVLIAALMLQDQTPRGQMPSWHLTTDQRIQRHGSSNLKPLNDPRRYRCN